VDEKQEPRPPVTLTYEQFLTRLDGELRGWISRTPRPLSSWWMSVEDYARVEFNRAYVKDHPKKNP